VAHYSSIYRGGRHTLRFLLMGKKKSAAEGSLKPKTPRRGVSRKKHPTEKKKKALLPKRKERETKFGGTRGGEK